MLLQDLALILTIAGFTAFIFHKLDQPKVIGYVLAGLIIGPNTPPFNFIHDEQIIRTLGDIGLVFLMFSLGVDFNLRRLRTVGGTAFIVALLDVAIMLWIGFILGRFMGWAPVESLFLGAIICDSSSTILAKILNEMGLTREKYAGAMIGITLVEDMLAVIMIAILTGIAYTGTFQTAMVVERLWHLTLFLAMVIVAGLLTIPRLLNYIGRFKNDELLIVMLVGLCFGVAFLAVKLELSLALGAVLIGAIASESNAKKQIVALIDPLRHIFSAVFFVTIGLQLNPAALWNYLPFLLLITFVVIAGKFTMNFFGTLFTGHSLDSAIRIGAGMAQVGEFAFIISALAFSQGIGGESVYQIGVGVAVLTTILSPYMIRAGERGSKLLPQYESGRRWAARFAFYAQWIEQLSRGKSNSAIRLVVKRSIITIVMNLVLISAIFALGTFGYGALARYGISLSGQLAAFVCLACVIFSLPLYLAIIRKTEALAMMLAETALPLSLKGVWVRPTRLFITNALVLASIFLLFLLTSILSSTLLPSRTVFLLLTAVALFITLWARKRMSLVYSRAQTALESMISVKEPSPKREKTSIDTSLLHTELSPGIYVDSFELESQYTAAFEGRTLREVDLRRKTGATLIAIERKGQHMTNPNPDHTFLTGDRVFMLGTAEQIQAAHKLLHFGTPGLKTSPNFQ